VVGSISDRKGVDRRRQRGRLLAVKDGSVLRHPSWQFDQDRGDSRQGLDQVLIALRAVAPAPEPADALMTTSRPDLGDRTLADLFVDGEVALVVRLIQLAGDQS
jgi:predicted NAD/FAD-dependent oxidoreductase